MAVDGAFRLLHGTEMVKVRALLAEMDYRIDQIAGGPGRGHADPCWRDTRLALKRIDIEDEGDYREAWAEIYPYLP